MKKSQFVLIAGNDRDWAKSVADLFLAYGYEVEIVADGRQAVERSRRTDFDFSFMDVQMPVMNGVDSFFAIRALRPGARIVMMAGSHEPLVAKALAAGATGLLERPFAFERMLEIVETAA